MPGARANTAASTLTPGAPLRIVSIGGGTGLSTVLKGLKQHASYHGPSSPALTPPVEITAIVTVTDDGGSSGRLRRDFDMLPPGDIRNCMVALAEDEGLLTKLFNYRFESGRGLKGHSFGNLFLAVMSQTTGDFAQAVKLSSEVLAIAGRIYPSTRSNVTLRAKLSDGTAVDGESAIGASRVPIRRIELRPRACKPLDESLEAIRAADLITLGPGSLYTSIIPNLLVPGIVEAIAKSRALKACFVNLMWQPGETIGMSASDHLAAIERHAGRGLIDYAVLNGASLDRDALLRYARQQALPVKLDIAAIRDMGITPVQIPLTAEGGKIRHDPKKVAKAAIQLAKKGRRGILKKLREREARKG